MSTREERCRHGRDLRSGCPRSSHGHWKPRPKSIDPVEQIVAANAGLVAGLLPVRYGRMAVSPFGFFRGTAILQASDLFETPISGAIVQLCGDCHIMNFGGFATPERNIVFDINDFDETFPGPWEWDLKRLTVSLVLASRHRHFPESTAGDAARAAVASYRERVAQYAALPTLEVWYERIDFDDLKPIVRRGPGSPGAAFNEARRVGGQRRIADNPPFVYHFGQSAEEWSGLMHAFFKRYRESMTSDRRTLLDRFTFEDIAAKIVGIGSVGTRCTVTLFLSDDSDELLLQMKEARRSVLEPPATRSGFAHQGQRVVAGQRLMQAASDIFLGWAELPGSHDYYLRQLRDVKVSPDVETFDQRELAQYATMCGWALARAHAKAGDAPTIAGYAGTGDNLDLALARYAIAYADQVERDHATFVQAIAAGRIVAQTDGVQPVEFEP